MINTKTSCCPIESIDYFAFLPIGESTGWRNYFLNKANNTSNIEARALINNDCLFIIRQRLDIIFTNKNIDISKA